MHLIRYAEHVLASAIGAASSRLVLSLLLRKGAVSPKAALKLLDDASAAIQYSRDLLQHALDHARQGITVLDLSRLLPGGFCSLLLADAGADVIKVEDTGMGDYVRWSPPYHEGAEDSAKSALFLIRTEQT